MLISEDKIKEKLAKIKADERLSYPTATVEINAPLALVQLSMESKIDALQWVIGEKLDLIIG